MGSLRTHLFRTISTVSLVSIFYIFSSVEHDITKDPFEKLAQFRDWALERKPVEASADSHSHR